MTRFKKLSAVIAVGMSLTLFAGCGLVVKTDEAVKRDEDKVRNVILAEGDGIKVTLGEVLDEYNKLMTSWTAQYGAENMKTLAPQFEQQKIQIMDNMLRTQIMTKKADELKIPTQSDKMEADYQEIIKNNVAAQGGQAAFDKVLKDAGYTAESYKTDVYKGLRLENLLTETTKDVAVTDDEINKYYEENKATSFTTKPGAKIYHIFFGKGDDAAAEAKAKEAKVKLDGGAKFEDMATEYGQDDSKTNGGLLGTFPWDTQELGADFMAEAKKLKEGEISGPVKTSFGWHIIKVTNVANEPKVQLLTDKITGDDGVEKTVKEDIHDLLLSNKKNERIAALLDEWETQYNVKRYPERIPMEYPNTSTQPTDTQAATTPAGTTVPGATTTPGETTPAATTPAATTAPATSPAATTAPETAAPPAATTPPATTTP